MSSNTTMIPSQAALRGRCHLPQRERPVSVRVQFHLHGPERVRIEIREAQTLRQSPQRRLLRPSVQFLRVALPVDQPGLQGLRTPVPLPGQHPLPHGRSRHLRLDQFRESLRQRHSQVQFREAKVSPLRPHEPKVARQRQEQTGAERVPVDRGDGAAVHGQDAGQDAPHRFDHGRGPDGVGRHPFDVEAVAEEFAPAGDDEGLGMGGGFGGVEGRGEEGDEFGVEAVLTAIEEERQEARFVVAG
mmetsp:Transcript_12882/g.26675  ORF Transcript_12882/g.26675 Transcript_12882/m.26675 type:complete len:244 (-) Transcript_12882:121-852(-)